MKYFVTLFLLAFNITFSQLKLNEQSPKINITNWIANVPKDKDLSNKYIVLEFWATFCHPCLNALPHLNELQSKFENEDLVFLSITHESDTKVKKILKSVDFKSVVVSDTSKTTQKNFGDAVKGIKNLPLTVLIDKNNIVKWIGTPRELTVDLINDFIENVDIATVDSKTINYDKLNLNSKNFMIRYMKVALDDSIEYYFEIDKPDFLIIDINKRYSVKPSFFSLTSRSLNEILIALNYNENQIAINPEINNDRYTIIYKNEKLLDNDYLVVENEILDTLKVSKVISKKDLVSNSISISNKKLLEVSKEKEASEFGFKNETILFRYNINMLCEYLNTHSSKLFHFNEKKDTVFYNFKFTSNDINIIMKDLENKGIQFNEERKKYDYYELVPQHKTNNIFSKTE